MARITWNFFCIQFDLDCLALTKLFSNSIYSVCVRLLPVTSNVTYAQCYYPLSIIFFFVFFSFVLALCLSSTAITIFDQGVQKRVGEYISEIYGAKSIAIYNDNNGSK